MDNYYELLGVDQSADTASLKSAYRSAMKESHPDKSGDATDAVKINWAYAVLADPVSRVDYDREIGQYNCAVTPAQSTFKDWRLALVVGLWLMAVVLAVSFLVLPPSQLVATIPWRIMMP